MIVAIYVEYAPGEYDRLDMFDDEKISLKFKVKDSTDIGKMFSTYSQTFTVPASDKNNRLLDYFFDTTVVRSSTKYINAKIYVNDTLFKLGKIALNEAAMKYNSQSNYNINFFTGLSTLKDLVGDDLLTEIFGIHTCIRPWTSNSLKFAFETDNNSFTNIPGMISYRFFIPPVSTKRVWTFGDQGTNDIKFYAGGNTNKYVSLDEVRPAIGLMEVLTAVFLHYDLPVDYSEWANNHLYKMFIYCNGTNFKPSKFNFWFNSIANFNDLYSPQSGYGPEWNVTTTSNPEVMSIQYVDDVNVNPLSSQVDFIIRPNVISSNPDGNILKYKLIDKRPATYGNILKEGICNYSVPTTNPPYYWFSFPIDIQALGMTSGQPLLLGAEFEPNFFFTYTQSQVTFVAVQDVPGYPFEDYVTVNNNCVSYNIPNYNFVDFTQGLPKIKVIDFLSSLFKMFNTRVVEPLNGNSTISYWISGDDFYTGEVDYSDYVDSTAHTIKPPDVYKTLSFGHKQGKYRSSVDWALANTNNPNSKEFGQLIYSTNNQYDKNTYDIKTSFTIVPNVKVEGSNISTFYGFTSDDGTPNTIYGTIYKPNLEDFTIFNYTNQGSIINSSTGAYEGIGIKGTSNINPYVVTYNRIALDTTYVPSQFHESLGFKDEVSPIYPAFIYTNNLYSRFYSKDISRLYNPNTKIFTFQGYLPSEKLLSFSLKNIVIIGNEKYTIEEADIDITTGKMKLVLMNYAPVNVSPSIFGLAPTPPINVQTEIL